MNEKVLATWFSAIAAILVFFGLLNMVFGLGVLPVKDSAMLNWQTALYGSLMMGWGATLLMVGRFAFAKNNIELKKGLLTGLAIWLVFEAIISAKFGIWFNVLTDLAVLILFAVPLVWAHIKK